MISWPPPFTNKTEHAWRSKHYHSIWKMICITCMKQKNSTVLSRPPVYLVSPSVIRESWFTLNTPEQVTMLCIGFSTGMITWHQFATPHCVSSRYEQMRPVQTSVFSWLLDTGGCCQCTHHIQLAALDTKVDAVNVNQCLQLAWVQTDASTTLTTFSWLECCRQTCIMQVKVTCILPS